MNQNTFSFLNRILNKIEDLVRHLVLLVKEDLTFLIEPVIGKVHNSNWFPVVWNLFACTVYHMRYFVGHYEFQIL